MKRSITILSAIIFSGAMSSFAMAQTPLEMANFNHYLDKHPEVAQRLAADPRLADNPQFLANHPGFQKFLANHPGVSSQLRTEPGQFVNREGHYEWSHGGGPIASAPGTAAGPVARFDNGYLDEHPEVARELGRDPRLVDNPQFLATHPGFDSYLAAHPGVRTELQTHPDRFMSDEWRDDVYGRRGNLGDGITRGEVSRFDNGYLDEHPEVAQQLGHDPRLADNPQFLATHPGLDSYLAAHPGVRTELQAHPGRFMTDEWKHERFEDGHGHPLANTDHYLDHHPEVSQQLSANPKLIDNRQYVDDHPGLHEFLTTHPTARAEWKSRPKQFMNREAHYDKRH
jgi:hypothetical protein